jgi:hypothetical protein
MSFLRRPAWVGSLTRPATSSFTPRENWTLVNLLNFEDGGADGTAYTSPVANAPCDGDYGFDGRIWVDAGGVLGKSLRFGRQVEIGGSSNGHYRGYIIPNSTYITNANMLTEGRITFDQFVPTNPNFRGNVIADPQVWFFTGVWQGPPYILFGFETNTTTIGLFLITSADVNSTPALAKRDIGASAAPGWHSIDFRYKLHATEGYAWVQWDNLDPIYFNNTNTAMTPINLFGSSCGSTQNSNNDLTYFGALDNLRFWQPA